MFIDFFSPNMFSSLCKFFTWLTWFFLPTFHYFDVDFLKALKEWWLLGKNLIVYFNYSRKYIQATLNLEELTGLQINI